MLERLKRVFRSGKQTKPWSGEMVLEKTGPGGHNGYRHAISSTVAVRWVSRDLDFPGRTRRLVP